MQTLPDLVSGQVLLVIAPQAAWQGMLEMAARLSLRGALRVLDGGNQFNAYQVARALRRHTTDIERALGRIDLARVFTCYQMETLLLQAMPQIIPTLVLDFLSTFYDENVPFAERRRLVLRCAGYLRRLSARVPVVVSAQPAAPPPPGAYREKLHGFGHGIPGGPLGERAALLDLLRRSADQVSEWEPPPPILPQPGLF